jgi:hypothetical protein
VNVITGVIDGNGTYSATQVAGGLPIGLHSDGGQRR